jgi:hypothetical protein
MSIHLTPVASTYNGLPRLFLLPATSGIYATLISLHYRWNHLATLPMKPPPPLSMVHHIRTILDV